MVQKQVDFVAHLRRQREWSERTFGPGVRLGVVDHIRKELLEIEAAPTDLSEWIDVAILAFDGAWRAGHSPEAIIDALLEKQAKNEARTWPDWRTMRADKAIEHDRSVETPAPQAETPIDRASKRVAETFWRWRERPDLFPSEEMLDALYALCAANGVPDRDRPVDA